MKKNPVNPNKIKYKKNDIIGALTIISDPWNDEKSRQYVIAECICGTIKEYAVSNLGKVTFSCGCRSNKKKGRLAKDGKKICTRCGIEKDIDDFNKENLKKDGLKPHCKECERLSHIKNTYNITIDEYFKLLKDYNEECYICGSKEKLSIDHNHNTNEIRGILCRKCNSALGLFNENIRSLKRAIKYLNR